MSTEMKELGFGQSVGQIVQMAYVVEDIRAAMDLWIRDCGVGPWFLLETFTGPSSDIVVSLPPLTSASRCHSPGT
jgi:hypothetical protein